MTATPRSRPGWVLLVRASGSAVAWPAVLGGVGLAAGLAAVPAVLPGPADGLLPPLAVLVLACGLAAAADDGAPAVAGTSPVPERRRLLARVLVLLPVSALALAAVLAVAAWVGAAPDRGLVLLWAATGGVALAAGLVGRRVAGVPGSSAAAAVLGTGLVLVVSLPPTVWTVAAWDSTTERVLLTVLLGGAAVGWATRDRAARPVLRSWSR